MTSELLKYIEALGVSKEPIKHKWKDNDPLWVCGHGESKVSRQIGKLTDRAITALAAGFATWGAARLRDRVDTSLLLQKIEATWAAIVDYRYVRPPETAKPLLYPEDWKGPERGPIYVAVHMLNETLDSAMREQATSPYAGSLAQLVIHIIGKPKPFKEWYEAILKRFVKLYLGSEEDLVGPPVPQEALDPARDFDSEASDALLGTFVRSLNHSKNPYLRSPKEVLSAGFKGTPYQFPA